MELKVVGSDISQGVEIHALPMDTVLKVKNMLNGYNNTVASQKQLFYNDKELLDDSTLADHGIEYSSILQYETKVNEIFVEPHNGGRNLTFNVCLRTTRISALKAEASSKFNITGEFFLSYKDRMLDPYFTCEEYGIELYDTLKLYIKESDDSFQINLRSKKGEYSIQTVGNQHTVRQLKAAIGGEKILLYNGILLEDDRVLKSFEIMHGSLLDIAEKDSKLIIKGDNLTYELTIESALTVKDLKMKIESNHNILSSNQRLVIRGNLLKNHQFVALLEDDCIELDTVQALPSIESFPESVCISPDNEYELNYFKSSCLTEKCSENVTSVCKCKGTISYFCKTHFQLHMTSGGTHSSDDYSGNKSPTSQEKTEISQYLNEKLRFLNAFRNKVADSSKKLVDIINEIAKDNFNNIEFLENNIIKAYNLLEKKSLEENEQLYLLNLINAKWAVKVNPSIDPIVKRISDYFSQELATIEGSINYESQEKANQTVETNYRIITDSHKIITRLAQVPDQSHLITAGDCDLRIWNMQTKAQESVLRGHTKEISSLQVTSDSKLIISGSLDGQIKVWDLAGQKLLYSLACHRDYISSLVVSSDNEFLASGSYDKTIHIWSLLHRRKINRIECAKKVVSLALTTDSSTLVYSSRKSIFVRDYREGILRCTITEGSPFCCIALSSDNIYLISGSSMGRINIFDLGSGQIVTKINSQYCHREIKTIFIYNDENCFVSADSERFELWKFDLIVEPKRSESFTFQELNRHSRRSLPIGFEDITAISNVINSDYAISFDKNKIWTGKTGILEINSKPKKIFLKNNKLFAIPADPKLEISILDLDKKTRIKRFSQSYLENILSL